MEAHVASGSLNLSSRVLSSKCWAEGEGLGASMLGAALEEAASRWAGGGWLSAVSMDLVTRMGMQSASFIILPVPFQLGGLTL